MAKVRNIVCNCEIDETNAVKMEYGGRTYNFCTPTFEDNPEKYIK